MLGKHTLPRWVVCLTTSPIPATQFPAWRSRSAISGVSLGSVDNENTHAVSGGKPSAAETLQALPTHASDICLQFSSLPSMTEQGSLNK